MTDAIHVVGRLSILASIAYYGLDTPLVSDAQFDEWSRRLHDEWDDLDPVLQFKLGDPHSIHTSGYHIKCSMQDLGGLSVWLTKKNMFRYRLAVPANSWRRRGANFRYCNVGDVQWDKRHPVS